MSVSPPRPAGVQAQGPEALLRAERLLVALVAHDLKSPLAAIASQAELLRQMEGPAELQRVARNLERSSNSALQLVEALVDLQRLRAGSLAPRPSRLRLESLVVAAVDRQQPLASAREVELLATGPANLPRLVADERLLGRALGHLLAQAVRSSPRGGRVRVDWGRADRRVWVEVMDDGPGLADADLEGFFDADRQLAREGLPVRAFEAGLGPGVARALARLHGGQVTARNQTGGGFTVRLELPGRGLAPAPGALAALVLDPAGELEKALRPSLLRRDVAVFAAAGLREAGPLVREEQPDLLFFDSRTVEAAALRQLLPACGPDWPCLVAVGPRAPEATAWLEPPFADAEVAALLRATCHRGRPGQEGRLA